MAWNHRLLQDTHTAQGKVYPRLRLIECYYAEDGITPQGWCGTDEALMEYGDPGVELDIPAAVKAMDWTLTHLKAALAVPVLTLADFPSVEDPMGED